ncbi:MAG: RibD family protein, partial [Bdellovibrionales bacterium]
NGMIASAPGERTQISGHDTHEYLHLLRSTYDAIAVGIGTVLADDPMLTARVEGYEHSIVRIVFDSSLKIPIGSKLVQTAKDEPVWVFYKNAADDKKDKLLGQGVTLFETGACVTSALHQMAEQGITRLLVEGGATLHHSFLQADVFDEVQQFQSHKLLPDDGVKAASFDFDGMSCVEKRDLGEDLLEIYRR